MPMFWFTGSGDEENSVVEKSYPPHHSNQLGDNSVDRNLRDSKHSPLRSSSVNTSAAVAEVTNGSIKDDVMKGALSEMHEELLLSKAQENNLKKQIAVQKELTDQTKLEMEELKAAFNGEREYFKAQMAGSRRFVREIQSKTVAASQKWQNMRDSMRAQITELAEIVEFQMLELQHNSKQLAEAREELKVYKENARVAQGEEQGDDDSGGGEEWQIMITQWVAEKLHLKKQMEVLSSTAEERLALLEGIIRACDSLRRVEAEVEGKDAVIAAKEAAYAQKQFFVADNHARSYLRKYSSNQRASPVRQDSHDMAQHRARAALDSVRYRMRSMQEPIMLPEGMGLSRSGSMDDDVPVRSPLDLSQPATPIGDLPTKQMESSEAIPTKSAQPLASKPSDVRVGDDSVTAAAKSTTKIPPEPSYFSFWT